MSEEIIPEANASDVELEKPELEETVLGESVIEPAQEEETPDYQANPCQNWWHPCRKSLPPKTE